MTPLYLTEAIVKYYKPEGLILEPCKGTGNFLKVLPPETMWCELDDKVDFFDFKDKIEKHEYSQLSKMKELDLNRLDDVLKDIPDGDFIAFIEREIENSQRSYNTIRNYRLCLSYLKRFNQ